MHLSFVVAFNTTTLFPVPLWKKKKKHYRNKHVPIKNYSKKAVFKILEIPFCKTAAVQDFRIFPEIILSKNIRCSKF